MCLKIALYFFYQFISKVKRFIVFVDHGLWRQNLRIFKFGKLQLFLRLIIPKSIIFLLFFSRIDNVILFLICYQSRGYNFRRQWHAEVENNSYFCHFPIFLTHISYVNNTNHITYKSINYKNKRSLWETIYTTNTDSQPSLFKNWRKHYTSYDKNEYVHF